ncbi:MAG: hypothetical protein FJ276_32975 [Planctomycetes bacterium]|nr:hypothetical protein [Planctomycetota bacterium]
MGQMRFFAPSPDELLPHAVELAYLAGVEGVPWRSRNQWCDGVLQISRSVSESGNLFVPWNVPGHGHRVLSTGTLMERSEPYCLVTELARGTLSRARCLATELDANNLAVPDDARSLLQSALAALIRATTAARGPDDDAALAIAAAFAAIELLCRESVRVNLSARHAHVAGKLPTFLACTLTSPHEPDETLTGFLDAFHAVSIPFRWHDLQPEEPRLDWSRAERQVRWCREHGLSLLGGPLARPDPLQLPDWITRRALNYDAFEQRAMKLTRQIVERFESDVNMWVCASRLNDKGPLRFSEEQALRLTVATIETIRSVSARTPLIVSFDQPWAEYLAAEDYDLSPLHFADSLVRADIGVAGVGLEMNVGCWPGGTLPRDLLEISRHIDRWSVLGIPLVVFLTVPDRAGEDPQVTGSSRVVPREPPQPSWPAVDHGFAEQLVTLLLCKPSVHGIVWNQLGDAEPHEFPHTGLLDAEGRSKPLLKTLATIRQQHLA